MCDIKPRDIVAWQNVMLKACDDNGEPYSPVYRRCLGRDIVVQGNPKVYKALKDQLATVLDELKRIEAGAEVDDELLENINLITRTLDGLNK